MEEEVERDDAKRKSRNLSEKKRRDQFNILINELNSMVSSANRKLDKTTVLKATISFLRQHNDMTTRSRIHEIHENWKPSFLSNEEFTHLMLEALDGFIIVFSSAGNIYYASESITSLMGHLPSDLLNSSIYEMIYEKEHPQVQNILSNPVTVIDPLKNDLTIENQVSFICHMKKGGLEYRDEDAYESVHFIGYFRNDVGIDGLPSTSSFRPVNDLRLLFVGVGRTQTPQLVREMTVVDTEKSEFTSRHSLEWKFIYLDHRATPIIGYLPFEVLGTSGYDYNHFDDLDNIVDCHETVMEKGEGNSGYYRFLTKSQQWIWLQTRFYISYHQWNSKPEFIVCTHRVVSNTEVLKQFSVEQKESDSKSDSSKISQMKPIDRKSADKSIRMSSSSIRTRYATASPTPTAKSDSRNCAAENAVSKARSSPCFSSSSKGSSKYSMSNQSNIVSKVAIKKMKKSDRVASPFENRNQPIVKMEYSPALQSTPHSELAQDQQYNNQIANMGPNFPPMEYIQTQYDKQVLPIGSQSPAVPTLHTTPDGMQREVIITSTQSHIQNQLQRKHEELQQLIMKQQEELQMVSAQLHLAQRGMLPVVSSTQIEPQLRAQQIDKTDNNHRTVLRLMDNAPYAEPTAKSNFSVNPELADQLIQIHPPQDFHPSTALTHFEETNQPNISSASIK